jgi:hypothetical protein
MHPRRTPGTAQPQLRISSGFTNDVALQSLGVCPEAMK